MRLVDDRIWDLRKLESMKETAITSTTDEAIVARAPHGLSTSGCYFDPTGTKAASTSYDNHIRCASLTSFLSD